MEYQGDEILQESGIPTGKFVVVKNADDAEKMAASLDTNDFMVKAQVLTGGRGKGKFKNSRISGVRIATSPAEVAKTCKKMLGDYLITKQTSEDGIVCNAVLVAERHFPRKEFYFAITMHRAFDGPVVIASTQGGMDIEEVAIVDPEAVLYEPVDIMTGLKVEQALEITKKLKIVEKPESLAEILVNLYKIFEKDAILVELNPLALDIHNNYLCLDCKMEFDESADYKQPEIFAKKDISQLDARELAAIKENINYVALTGNIGCMVNGAGLAMATMDIIKLHGGEPANFLDVGGGATVKTVETCFEIITSNKNVDCIFVNIFGGIMRCDVIAQGIVTAAHKLKLKQLPIVCRLRGTNVAEAKAIIAASEMRILSIDDLDEGAKIAVKVSKIRHLAKEAQLDVNFELIGI
ncbi:succinate--CoA ligase [ADP-forming] subunit beta, mitochondrial-like [Nilaparvata lugens]|uniref:succinate--CoA ligase [ADP-forming] subunit beta, mitochondrial-like n=1 Tax=Nilaparvata lugens TaxID=108931 RepID=UPI00193DD6A1|nr:succinate--CoA ligase [ADP-forming] subunit beta, mitochondrial-like [Nilaparvata lugens]